MPQTRSAAAKRNLEDSCSSPIPQQSSEVSRPPKARKKRRNAKVAASAGSVPSTPTLLGIPGELRNHIYRYALVEEREIRINDHPEQPGLLRTCRKIRKEAEPIFHENEFCVAVYGLKLPPYPLHWCWKTKGEFAIEGPNSWVNFKDWLKRVHAGDVGGFAPGGDLTSSINILGQAFSLVATLKETPWNVVEQALEAFRAAVEIGRRIPIFKDKPSDSSMNLA